MIGIVSVWNVKCVRIVGFSKYNRVLLHYSVSMAAVAAAAAVAYVPLSAAAAAVAYIPLSAAAAAAVAHINLSAAAAAAAAAYIPLSAADTHHCSVDTDELFHAYFFYVSTWHLFSNISVYIRGMLKTSRKTRLSSLTVWIRLTELG
jgi:hypothetical protein